VSLPAPPDPTLAEQVQAELAALDPSQRAVRMAEHFQDEVWLCPGAAEAFKAVAKAPARSKCDALAHGLGEALGSCPFTSSARVVTLAHVMATPAYTHQPTWLALSLDPSATTVSATGRWDAILQILADREGGSAWLEPAAPEAP